MSVPIRLAPSSLIFTVVVALTVEAACSHEAVDGVEAVVGTVSQVLDPVPNNPGSARLEVSGSPGSLQLTLVTSTSDEFVRVGETLGVALPAWLLWETLHPSFPLPGDARLKSLQAILKVAFLDRDHALRTQTLTLKNWAGTQYDLVAHSSEFLIPVKSDVLRLSMVVRDGADIAPSTPLPDVAVFGGELPTKTLLFDSNGSTPRERVIEGGTVIRGAKVLLAYTDWRADLIVQKDQLNAQIGVATFSGRYGNYSAPIYGGLVYDVLYGVSFDGGLTFQPDVALVANTAPRILGPNRTDFEGTLTVPTTASQLQIIAHVKATLVADYAPYQDVTQKFYTDNQRVLLKEVWDGSSGPGAGHVIPVQ